MTTIYNKKVTEIRKTNDYSLFKNILGNRSLKDKNYNKLLKSMRENQLVIPILINENWEIIDGQHRYNSCKTLGLPVYYYMIEGYAIEEVKIANQVSCNWGTEDYLNLHVELENHEYLRFKRVLEIYNLKTPQLLKLISMLNKDNLSKLKLDFQDGVFVIDNYDNLIDFLDKLQDFNIGNFTVYNSTKFTEAFAKLYMYSKYDHNRMVERLASMGYKLEKRQLQAEYLSLLVNDIYSYGSSKAMIKYDAKNNSFYSK